MGECLAKRQQDAGLAERELAFLRVFLTKRTNNKTGGQLILPEETAKARCEPCG